MKWLSHPMASPLSMAALVGLAIVAPVTCAQTVTGVDGSIIVVERSVLGDRLARNMATDNTSTVRLAAPRRNSTGADGTESIQPTRKEQLSVAVRDESSAQGSATTAQRYFITDLGTLGGTQSFAYAVNDLGQVVGFSLTAGDASGHSFLYSNGKMTDLYPLNSQNIVTVGPTGINNAGQIASGVAVGGVYVPAVLDSKTGEITLTGSLGGVTPYGFNGVATSVNNVGNAVGYSYIDSINRHAFLYSSNVITDIGSFGGYSAALAIDDEDLIVGFSSNEINGVAHAFVYSAGVMTNIHPATESEARDVNNEDQVVGDFLTADQSAFHAFLYSIGNFTDLGSADSPETIAFAINDPGQVVGITSIPFDSVCSGVPCIEYKQHAFLYNNGRIADLNDLIPENRGWELTWAFDVNNAGQIVGYGLINGKFRAYLLTSVINKKQCQHDGWNNFGFKNQGQCIQFVNTGK